MKTLFASVTGIALSAAAAHAAISITNGDFQTSAPASNQANVVGWFDDAQQANWWEGAWYGPTVSPNGTSVLGLSYMFTVSHWAYQSIGTNSDSMPTLALRFDAGSFTDAGGPRNLGITFSVYQSDGTFTAADNTDIAGAPGITLIDSFNVATGNLNPGQMLTGLTGSLNLTTANTSGELYLRMTNYVAGTGEPWAAVDNISIIPEPGAALLGAVGMISLLRRRKR